ncbi:MAG: MBL fold metallo-hydrolase [Vicinamibacterales bacterium]
MAVLTAGIRYVDLHYRGVAGVIATGVIDTPDGPALVDPGPAICLPELEAQLASLGTSLRDVCALLLTHIHLDHAGASGVIARDNPRVRVYVHERGAPHLVDPSKLLASATRLYGPRMDEIWGPFLPVPRERVSALAGRRERIDLKQRTIEVLYTPGHAYHHVSYLDVDSRVAFVGDVGGVHMPGHPYVLPPTPPPDIDLDAWRTSIAQLTAWAPSALLLAHFGPNDDTPAVHLQKLLERLESFAARVKRLLDEPGSEDEKVTAFIAGVHEELARDMGTTDPKRFAVAVPPDQCWQGLARYWRKKTEAAHS